MMRAFFLNSGHRQPDVMVAYLRAGEALYIVVLFPGNNTTIQCLARAQAGNHNIGLPMFRAELLVLDWLRRKRGKFLVLNCSNKNNGFSLCRCG